MVAVPLLTELVMHGGYRTIMALWKARSLSLEQKVRMVEESESKSLQTEEGGSFLGLEDVYMPEVYSAVPSLPVSLFLSLFLHLCRCFDSKHSICVLLLDFMDPIYLEDSMEEIHHSPSNLGM